MLIRINHNITYLFLILSHSSVGSSQPMRMSNPVIPKTRTVTQASITAPINIMASTMCTMSQPMMAPWTPEPYAHIWRGRLELSG